MPPAKKIAVIGAGPAGLAAAYSCTQAGLQPLVLEATSAIGGIARTEEYKGYLFDIGGHRFFTKSDAVNRLWEDMLGEELLGVARLSRIYYDGRFFKYPIGAFDALSKLGVMESTLVVLSYAWAQLFPSKPEETFEQWVSNRFGRRLYDTFFQTYTEKVWGIPCHRIRADWAAQRIRGLSLTVALANAVLRQARAKSLIEEFRYPSRGPGMMWNRFRERIEAAGGEVRLGTKVVRLEHRARSVTRILTEEGGRTAAHSADHVISSAPLGKLVAVLDPPPPAEVREAARGLTHRSFLIVVLIVSRRKLFPDQWIYIHSPDVRVGRIQNFRNWSSAMVPDPATSSVGLEYFCNEGDDLWSLPDSELAALAARELARLGFAGTDEVVDHFVVRQPDAYPVYDENYQARVSAIRSYLGGFSNLQTIGRSGMHRYNNMDHSMLTGMFAVQNVLGARHDLWEVNEEAEYLEEARGAAALPAEAFQRIFARMDKLAFATALGSLSGIVAFLATAWLLIKGGDTVGPNLQLLGQYFVGYTVSWRGAFLGMLYGLGWGFLLGWLFAYSRNLMVAIYLFRIRRRAQRGSLRQILDYI